jgi:hypothetical protein
MGASSNGNSGNSMFLILSKLYQFWKAKLNIFRQMKIFLILPGKISILVGRKKYFLLPLVAAYFSRPTPAAIAGVPQYPRYPFYCPAV